MKRDPSSAGATFLAIVIVLGSLVTVVSSAIASIRPDVSVELVGEPFIAEVGDGYTRTLRVTVGTQGILSQISVQSPGWTISGFVPPASVSLQAGEFVEIPLSLTAIDPDRLVEVTADFDGLPIRRTLNVSPRLTRWVSRRLPVVFGFPPNDTTSAATFPTLREEDQAELQRSPAKSRSIRARGRITYPYGGDLTDLRGAHGVTVVVKDKQWVIADRDLGSAQTDANGDFDISFPWTFNGDPDLYVEVRAETPAFEVRAGTFLGTGLYTWESDVQRNFTGTDWSLTENPVSAFDASGALHVVTSLWRTNLFMENAGTSSGFGAPAFTVHWPEDGSFYTRWNEVVHIETSDTYDDATITHEYGHHWINSFGTPTVPDYDNGYCDDPTPGHCIWCPENPQDAYSEGFPDFLGHVIPRTYPSEYGVTSTSYGLELPGTSSNCPGVFEPNNTEGYCAAILIDIMDSTQDKNGETNPYVDSLIDPIANVFEVADLDAPTTPREFILAYLDRFPNSARGLWETARSVGFNNLDTVGPGTPAGLISTSHDIGVEIADRRIEILWFDTSDDFSGVLDFSVEFAASPTLPAEVVDLTTESAAPSFTSRILEPGTWYANVRPRDRAGNWSSTYASAGPFLIREAIEADVTFANPGAGWPEDVALRGDTVSDDVLVSPSTTLPGDQLSTYWNFGVENLGDLAMGQPTIAQLYVDGVRIVGPGGRFTVENLSGGQRKGYVNAGPVQVTGGRHTIAIHLDDGATQVSESDESNNVFAFQRVFEPTELAADVVTRRSAPPVRDGGYEDLDIPAGTTLLLDNMDAMRIDTSTGLWTATAMWNASATSDYALSLHPASTSQDTGFGPRINADTGSARATRELDVVVTHEVLVDVDARDIGITRLEGGGPYDILTRRVDANEPGSVVIATLGDGDPIQARSIAVNSAFSGPKRFEVQTLSGEGPVHVAVFSPASEVGNIDDALGQATTDTDGNATFEATLDAVGSHLFLFWREPDDGLAGSVQLRVDTFAGSYALASGQPSGWDAAIVPRPDTSGDAGGVSLPDSLDGETTNTYFNFALSNPSSVPAPSADLSYSIDGSEAGATPWPAMDPGVVVTENAIGPVEVRGGRHLVTTVLQDPSVPVGERRVASVDQFVWTPLALSVGDAVMAAAPPDPLAGFAQGLDVGSGLAFMNADGHRIPVANDRVTGVFVLPEPADDVDLRAHRRATGPRSGFGEALAFSGWPQGESDFVLHNGARAGGAPFDTGVFGLGAAGSYQIQVVAEQPTPIVAGTPRTGSFGVLDLADIGAFVSDAAGATYELNVALPPGQGTPVGASVYSVEHGFYGKSDALALQIWEPDGSTAPVEFTTPEPGKYVLVVWRVANEATKALAPVDYEIELDASGATDTPPATTSPSLVLVSTQPNPFNPRTEIRYRVTQEDDVLLAIYNVRGQLVRTLHTGVQIPGSHSVVWDGRGSDGNEVTSGIYLVRLDGHGQHDVRKIALVR